MVREQRHCKTNDAWEFKPALAETIERPASPTKRAVFILVGVLFVIAVIASIAFKVDVVVEAGGKLIPEGDVKTAQPLDEGVVKAILVEEGQRVVEGQPLVEIDPKVDAAVLEGKEKELWGYRLCTEGVDAILTGTPFVPPPDAPREIAAAETMLRTALAATRDAFLHRKDVEKKKIAVEKAALGRRERNLEKAARLRFAQAERLAKLAEDGVVAASEAEAAETVALEAAGELEEVIGLKAALGERLAAIDTEVTSFVKDFEAKLHDERTRSVKAMCSLLAEIEALRFRASRRLIVSPTVGTVQELHIKTVGGVVTPAQPVATIVPENVPLTATVMVAHKDAGDVTPGLPVRIKFEAYDYQKYGFADGEVADISATDIVDKDGQPMGYRTKISLTGEPEIAGRPFRSGMAVSAEINVGTRRVIELALNPLLRGLRESAQVK